MGKTATITARIEPELKRNAETVLEKLGVNTTDAVTMFLSQVVLLRGLPFEVRLPNATTRAAIIELEAGGGHKSTAGTGEAFHRALRKGKKPTK